MPSDQWVYAAITGSIDDAGEDIRGVFDEPEAARDYLNEQLTGTLELDGLDERGEVTIWWRAVGGGLEQVGGPHHDGARFYAEIRQVTMNPEANDAE